ncbi:HTH DNA binding domain protein [Arthrobacter phage Shrooms]|nr:HTH DNA binding domain protein [Arthrobacter phage Shrooms]
MRFIEYQDEVVQYDADVVPQEATDRPLWQAAIGLGAITGDVLSEVLAADARGGIDDAVGEDMVRSLGATLRQVSRIASILGVSLDEVAATDMTSMRDDVG